MGFLTVLLALASTLLYVQAQNVVCPTGTSTETVTINDGNSYSFKTHRGKKYKGNTDCTVDYVMGDTCAKMSFICTKFSTNNKDKRRCSKGDTVAVTADGKTKKYCKTKKPKITSSGDISVVFTSDAKKAGTGAICKVKCTEAATESTTSGGTGLASNPSSTTTTTGPPPTTTTAPVPCVNCTTESGEACQFPFTMNGTTYTTCTVVHDTTPWCSTKVDADGNAILATNAFWGYCTSECPSDEGYPATGAGPACSVRTTGRGFPESCAAQQNKTDKNILFIGNSYTFYNNLQNMVRDLAIAAGFSPTVYSESRGGETLGGHVLNSLAAIRSDEWDVVVIQDQSQRPSFPNGYVYYNIIPESTTLVKAINDQNPCTVPVFFQTWGKRDGDSQNCADGNYLCFFDGIQNRLTESYNTFAYVNQPAKVAPAGEAFRIYENRGALFDSDGSHPSLAGSYLTACTLLETIWGVSCEGNSYQPVGDAIVLQEVAHQTVSSWNWEWPASGGPPCPHCFPPSSISPHRK